VVRHCVFESLWTQIGFTTMLTSLFALLAPVETRFQVVVQKFVEEVLSRFAPN
jgi:hypothetical protein